MPITLAQNKQLEKILILEGYTKEQYEVAKILCYFKTLYRREFFTEEQLKNIDLDRKKIISVCYDLVVDYLVLKLTFSLKETQEGEDFPDNIKENIAEIHDLLFEAIQIIEEFIDTPKIENKVIFLEALSCLFHCWQEQNKINCLEFLIVVERELFSEDRFLI